MQTAYTNSINIISILLTLISWGLVIALVFRQYSRQQVKPTLWKVILVTFVGVFSFTFNLNLSQALVKIPLLPLGVWIIYGFTHKKSWGSYRKYAWIGFWANFIFLATTLLSVPVHHWIYPKTELSTYISNSNNASIIPLNPVAPDADLNREQFKKQLKHVQLSPTEVVQWYLDSDSNLEPNLNDKQEKFPYQLVGTTSKWGNGSPSLIYIENDGKGILITTLNQQYYYRTEENFLVMGAHHDQ